MTADSTLERRFRVLIVEDNPAEAELISERLSEVCPDCEIVHVPDTTRASLCCEKSACDCVVLDLQLPDTAGAQSIEAIRARCPKAVIVAYSGMDNEASRVAALQAGAQHFISKNDADAQALADCVLLVRDRWIA